MLLLLPRMLLMRLPRRRVRAELLFVITGSTAMVKELIRSARPTREAVRSLISVINSADGIAVGGVLVIYIFGASPLNI